MPTRRHQPKRRVVSPSAVASARPGRNSGESRGFIPRSGWRGLLWRAALAIVIPVGFLMIGELGLRLFGYGYATTFFVRIKGQEASTTNPRFGWRFQPRDQATQPYPVILPATKPRQARRIFVLGDSAAQGTPAPAFGFVRLLEFMLRQQYPGQRFEVINAALRGINSHVVRHIAKDCASRQPDLFVVYLGNNEGVGLYSPEPDGVNIAAYPILLQTREWLRGMKGVQLLENLIRRVRRSPTRASAQDSEFFRSKRMAPEDPRREPVYSNFRDNLERICAAGRAAGAGVILSTVAVNLRDCPPLASLHRVDLTPAELSSWQEDYAQGTNAEARGLLADAVTHYLAAVRMDDHFAELHFRLGRCLLAVGEAGQAGARFALARDWDALPFRADRRLNQIIRETAASARDGSVVLVDAERSFSDASGDDQGVPGSRWFHEHVHFRFAGDYLMACTLLPAVRAALGLPPSSLPPLTLADCAEGLAYTAWDEIEVATAMLRLTANPPFLDQLDQPRRQAKAERTLAEQSQSFERGDGLDRSLRMYRAAVARQPEDWAIRANLAAFLNVAAKKAEATAEYAAAVRLMPVFAPLRVQYARVLSEVGRRAEAITELEEALRLQPEFAPARDGLRNLTSRR